VAVVADLSARRAARPEALADPRLSEGQLRTLERILARGRAEPAREEFGIDDLSRIRQALTQQG